MSEKPRGLSFEKIDHFNDRGTQEIQGFFQDADSVPANMVKNYAKEIAERINSAQTEEEQKIFLIDLLRDEVLEKIIETKGTAEKFSPEDLKDVEQMAEFSTKQIREAVAEELKKYIPEDLYFFVKQYIRTDLDGHNKRAIIENKGGEIFLKTSEGYDKEVSNNLRNGLEILKAAMEKLSDPAKEMPFLPQPLVINRPQNSDPQMVFGVKPMDITTIQDLFEDENISEREKIQALLDCFKGAKFLADNGLTLTDLNTTDPGRNMGINKQTRRGVLFDLDGLMPADKKVHILLGPMDNGRPIKELVSPEYNTLEKDYEIISRKESMIWEFGHTIYRLAKKQEERLYKSPNFFSNHNVFSMWEKLREFSEKMMADKPDDRPSFDICIIKLEGIINKYLPENN